MKLASVLVQVFSFLNVAVTASLAISLSRPGCQDKCGNVTIPYPFGIGSKCSANSSFTIICKNLTVNPPRPFLRSLNSEVVNISLYGVVIVNLPVLPVKCSDVLRREFLSISLEGSPFTISAHYNSLVVVGCRKSVWLLDNETIVGDCTALCDANSRNTSCNGKNCCQIAITSRLQELKYEYESVRTTNSSSCGYVFPCDKKWLQGDGYKRYKGFLSDVLSPFDAEFGFAPLVLEWEFGNTKRFSDSSSLCKQHDDDNYDKEDGHSATYDYVSAIRYCTCRSGFVGNPYIVEGCTYRGFDGTHPWYDQYSVSYYGDRDVLTILGIVFIVAGIGPRVLVFLIMSWKIGKVIKVRRKHTVYKRNGGLLLEQHLAAIERGIERAKLFSSKELAKATGNYSESRIVGRGGEGVVYKGMLEDGTVVAIKKSERVYKGDVEAFINEVVIVSQINHRNVVKLIGCGLESKVPRLVYEFIPNGTLFSHIHHSHQEIVAMAEVARRCLHLNGRSRPTMKEVARDLEGIQVEKQEQDSARNQVDSSGCNSVESDHYSSTSEIIELPSSGEF